MRFEFTNAKSGTTYIVSVRAVFANDKVGNWSTSGTLLTRKNCYSYSVNKMLIVAKYIVKYIIIN